MSSISLNYKTYFSYVQKLKNYFHLRIFNMFSFKESLIVPVKYFFRFLLVSKLCKSDLQVIHLNSDHLRFLDSVNIGGSLSWHILKNRFQLLVFFQMFFLFCKLYKLGLFMTIYFGHGQCFIWRFLVLAFKETARLFPLAIFPDLEMT